MSPDLICATVSAETGILLDALSGDELATAVWQAIAASDPERGRRLMTLVTAAQAYVGHLTWQPALAVDRQAA